MSRPEVIGLDLDAQTRCRHYRSPRDVVAIKTKCCGVYYACKDCHDAVADHPIVAWPLHERGAKAVLCGVCGHEMTVRAYLESDNKCPNCGASFNPGCRSHHHFYFEI